MKLLIAALLFFYMTIPGFSDQSKDKRQFKPFKEIVEQTAIEIYGEIPEIYSLEISLEYEYKESKCIANIHLKVFLDMEFLDAKTVILVENLIKNVVVESLMEKSEKYRFFVLFCLVEKAELSYDILINESNIINKVNEEAV